MISLLPQQLTLRGLPLYNELFLGLCRALGGPQPGSASTANGVVPHNAKDDRQKSAAEDAWRLIDGEQSDGVPIKATSLAELSRAVRDLRALPDGLESDLVSLAGNID